MKRSFALTLLFILVFSFFVSSSTPQVGKYRFVSPSIQEGDKYRMNVDLARELIRAGRADEALKLIDQLIDVYGDTEELHNLLKEAYLASKEYDKVEGMIREDLAREPTNWMLYCELANVYLKTEREEEAKLNLNQAIELAPDRKQVYSQVALVYLRNGLTSEAIDTYRLARMKLGDPSAFSFDLASLYEALFDYKQAVEEYFLFLGEDSSKFDLVEDRINRLIQTDENLDQIELALSRRIQENPQDRYSQKLFGDLLFRRQNLSGAFETYKKVDALFEAKGRFILEFIRMCHNKKFFDQATFASKYLLSTQPSRELAVSAKLYIARSFEGQKKFVDAIDTYQEIINDYQKFFTQQIALSHFRTGEINLFYLLKPDEAFACFQNVVSFYRDSDWYPDALVRLGDCMMVKGDLDSAQTLFLSALKDPKAESKEEEIGFKLIEIEFYSGNFEEALEGYQKVIADFPKGLYVNNSLERIIVIGENQELDRYLLSVFAQALLEKLQGKAGSALFKLDKIISAKSEKLSDLAQLEKAKIYRAEKKFSLSLKALNELLERYPESYFCAQAQKLIGDVYNYHLNDETKAIQAYRKLLKDYDRSVYVDEVRDKLRELKAETSPTSSG